MNYPKIVLRTSKDAEQGTVEVDLDKIMTIEPAEGGINTRRIIRSKEGNILYEVRSGGNLAGRSMYLGCSYDYIIGTDSDEVLVLIAVKK